MAVSEAETGIVLIGRNEGDRLKNCVRSLELDRYRVVYVDSGSTDGSVSFCQSQGVEVVQLDMSIPFTAARARNAGFQRLMAICPGIQFVQFVDGDCQLAPSWMDQAITFLQQMSDFAAVCGRRQETRPDASFYNRLCDIEWNTPVGEASACGGDVLMRASALKEAGGYREEMIAGEEPELCFRMRQNGWRIFRLDVLMTMHDADMFRFGQWWKRSQRAGYAYMKGALLHGMTDERYNVRPVLRTFFWAAVYPLIVFSLAILFEPAYLWLFLAYPLQWVRVAASSKEPLSIRLKWAFFNMLSKFSEFSGMLKCLSDSLGSRSATLIEYK